MTRFLPKLISKTALFFLGISSISAQIWDQKPISFPVESQGWKIRSVSENVAWTFGFSIAEEPAFWSYSGKENTCQRTIDGGKTWQSFAFKDTTGFGSITDIHPLDTNTAFLSYASASNGPELYKTTDGGATWTKNNAGITYYLNWVHFSDPMNGVAFGDPIDNLFFEVTTTSDGGATWASIDSTSSIEAIAPDEYGSSSNFTAKGKDIWTITNYARIFHSDNSGKKWTNIAPPPFNEMDTYLWGVVADDNKNLYAVYNENADAYHQIFKKVYNSSEWIEITPVNNQGYIAGFAAIPSSSAIIYNSATDFLNDSTFITTVSHSQGEKWNVISSGQNYRHGFLDFLNPQVGYSCMIPTSFANPSTNVYKCNNTPLTGILQNKAIDVHLSLSPNPTSETINVEFEGKTASDYWIIMNDLTGKLVFKKEIANATAVTEKILVSSLPKGSYIITVSRDDGLQSLKFVKQ
jgi:hypothetical protein